MRRLLSLLAAVCLALCLAACEAEPPDPAEPSASPSATPTPAPPVQSARFSLGYDPSASLHPITGESQVNQELTGLIYQYLYELDNAFTPRPALVQSAAVSEDGLTWTFTMREGALFSDGTPLTARHAADCLRAALNSALYAGRLADITDVWADEAAGTFTVVLAAPNGGLPALLDIPVALEREEGPPLGSGLYQYEQAGDSLFLRPNALHPSAAALPYDVIPLTPVTTAGERVAAFDSGSITAVTTDFSGAYALSYSSSYETCDYPTTAMIYVGFRAAGPCRSAPVRQAFSLAFNREELVRVLLSGHGDPASLPVHPALSGELEDPPDCDPESAAALLEQAGYTRNEEDGLLYLGRDPLSVTLLVNSDNETRQRIADLLAENLRALGVTVTVSRLAWKDYTAALTSGAFDLYIGEVRLTGDLDPSALLTGALNYGGFESAELAQALTAWRAASGEARERAAQPLWELLEQEAPVAALCFKRGSLLVRWGMVSNLEPTRANPFFNIEHWTTVSP